MAHIFGRQRKSSTPCVHYNTPRGCNRANCPFAHGDKEEGSKKGILATMLKLLFEKTANQIVDVNGVLHINNFRECQDLSEIQSSIDFNSMAFCEALAAVIKEKLGTPQFICVDNNNIRSLHHFLKALERVDVHSSLKGLSVANNQIDSTDFIKQLKPFVELQEIKLLGNPVTKRSDYRTLVRKGLPQLIGLDGDPIDRGPSSVPWPIRPGYASASQDILMNLEVNFFQALAIKGPDAVISLYHVDAMLSLTVSAGAEMKHPIGYPKDKKDIPRDFVALRMAQTDRTRNMLQGVKSNKVAKGRAEVCSALRHLLYPKNFSVQHELEPNADIQFCQQGVKVPVAILTFHGLMHWKHKDQAPSDDSVKRIFDRTMVLFLNAQQNWEITNDAIHLRPHEADPLFFPDTAERAQMLSRKYGVPPEVIQQAVTTCSNDAELALVLNDLKILPLDLLYQCIATAQQNIAHAVPVCRVVARTKLKPDVAYQALSSVGMDLDKFEGMLGTIGPECFLS